MEKSGTTNRYHSRQQQTVKNNINGKSNSNQSPAYKEDNYSCFCFENDDDSADQIWIKAKKRKIARSCIYNIVICTILVAYTFLGAIIFLVIEGDSDFYSLTSGNTVKSVSASSVSPNHSLLVDPSTVANTWLSRIYEESRARTVENIWDITVGLNILYRENWTRLVAQEITRYQEQLVQGVAEEMYTKSQLVRAKEIRSPIERNRRVEWNLPEAFLYSLTVLSTIGYGNSAPRTTLGKVVTMGFAAVGIPLMLLYLSNVGSLLSNCARGVCSRSLCCCLCSNCGYCCYDERRMQEKERRMRLKRERKEYEQQMQTYQHQEPFYVRSPISMSTPPVTVDNVDTDTPVGDNKDNWLAVLTLCFIILVVYISGGALVLCYLETSWTYLDAIFFCFMTLSTIGFGEFIPPFKQSRTERNIVFWFCSLYILIGMALTAMCFNVVHNVIVHRLKHNYSESLGSSTSVSSKQGSTSNFLDCDATVNNPVAARQQNLNNHKIVGAVNFGSVNSFKGAKVVFGPLESDSQVNLYHANQIDKVATNYMSNCVPLEVPSGCLSSIEFTGITEPPSETKEPVASTNIHTTANATTTTSTTTLSSMATLQEEDDENVTI